MKRDYITPTRIATVLQVADKKGRPHKILIGSILNELGLRQDFKDGNALYYDSDRVMSKVYTWFYERAGIEFPEVLQANGRNYEVRYLPEEELPAVKKSIA